MPRQQQLLLPAQYAREYENAWVDAADAFTSRLEIDDATDGAWVESPAGEPGREYLMTVDLGLVHDPSVIGVAHQKTA